MQKKWDKKALLNCLILSFILSSLFFDPLNKLVLKFDVSAFYFFNGLLESKPMQYLFGFLNHPYEKIINVFFMVGLNYFAYKHTAQSKKADVGVNIFVLWVTLELWLAIVHVVSRDWLDLMRDSPSLVLPVKIWLSEALSISSIKVTSNSSFPGGHAFVAFYWFFCSCRFQPSRFRLPSLIIALLISVPRVFSGAHWLSDVMFSCAIAYIAVMFDFASPLWYYTRNLIILIREKLSKCLKILF